MAITAYQAKYLAHELTRRYPSNSYERFGESLANARVDLNPHQVEASYFAFKSPLSHGALLADEVGLGKTIEAGILISQKWAERKRKLLVIVPSNLRKQWNQELQEKFFLPSLIMENASFKTEIKKRNLNPFNQKEAVVICSYHFARKQTPYIESVPWDLVIIDEAHRLRNVYKPSSKIANDIKSAVQRFNKVLLTATPLQNSLLELYGLASIIDEYSFGDLKSFKEQYGKFDTEKGNYEDLKQRLKPICHRTLRKQVKEYVNYTNRRALVQPFFPGEKEILLQQKVIAFLQREKLFSLPQSQRKLLTLMLLKLQASSTYAIAPTFSGLISKLEEMKKALSEPLPDEVSDLFSQQTENFDEIKEEWVDEEEDEDGEANARKRVLIITKADIPAINEEIIELEEMFKLAESVEKNSKGEQLLTALTKGFEEIEKSVAIDGSGKKANKKALIFTESTRTQKYLYDLLQQSEYKDQTVLFNGSNSDPQSNSIYQAWLQRHQGTGLITGSKTADKRAAITEYFRDKATIMIATEAAAEGINLQFCSFVMNYDLPWNPQRIEQRIGRCHRYGQKHDVVVVNFLNQENEADKRVYELLAEKFKLFDGVFGASDEVLGTVESGVALEKRIVEIYRTCRTAEQISEAFKQLQLDLEPTIEGKLMQARQTLLNNFDEEVLQKVKMNVQTFLDRYQRQLWLMTQYSLTPYATFNETEHSFMLSRKPFEEGVVLNEVYRLSKTSVDGHQYRVGHPLAQQLIEKLKKSSLAAKQVTFYATDHRPKVSALQPYTGKSGWLIVSMLSIDSIEGEDHLLVAAQTDEGALLEPEVAARLMELPAVEGQETQSEHEINSFLRQKLTEQGASFLENSEKRNSTYFDEEMTKLEKWAEDKKAGLEIQIKDIDKQIRLYKSESRKIQVLADKVKMQREIKELEKRRQDLRQSFFVAQDDVDMKKDTLLNDVESRLHPVIESNELFALRWSIV